MVAGVLAGLGTPVTYVQPAVWKRRAGLIGASKSASRHLATATWPDHAPAFRKARDDGRAEAALIARHG